MSDADAEEAYAGDGILLLRAASPAVPASAAVVISDERGFCDKECRRRSTSLCSCYCLVVIAMIFPSLFLGPIGLMIFALVPAVVVMAFSEQWYGRLITRCTMIDVFLEATCLILVPLGVAIVFIDQYLPMRPSCEDRDHHGDGAPGGGQGGGQGVGGGGEGEEDLPPAWRYAFQAFVRAAILEELVKYCAIRRLLHKPYVVDARSLLVYGAVSGAAFGVIENVGYALEGGIATAAVRSFLTVPLHASTGIMMGATLAPYRFSNEQEMIGGGDGDGGDGGGDDEDDDEDHSPASPLSLPAHEQQQQQQQQELRSQATTTTLATLTISSPLIGRSSSSRSGDEEEGGGGGFVGASGAAAVAHMQMMAREECASSSPAPPPPASPLPRPLPPQSPSPTTTTTMATTTTTTTTMTMTPAAAAAAERRTKSTKKSRLGIVLREQATSLVDATWAPVLLHGSYDCLLFVAAGECDEAWAAWLYLPAYACYVRWRVLSVERRFPATNGGGGGGGGGGGYYDHRNHDHGHDNGDSSSSSRLSARLNCHMDDDNDVHAKIRRGEIPKPCICCKCLGCVCCECCECCY